MSNRLLRLNQLKLVILGVFLCIGLGIGFSLFSNKATAQTSSIGQVILFDHDNFYGGHAHVVANEPNLNNEGKFNDRTSSIAVISGNWTFYRDDNYRGGYVTLGPGVYPDVQALGFCDDCITSVRQNY